MFCRAPMPSPTAWHGPSLPLARSANLGSNEVEDTGPKMYRSCLSSRRLVAGCTQFRGRSQLKRASKQRFQPPNLSFQENPKFQPAKAFPDVANGLGVALACGAGAWRVALGAFRQGFPLDRIPHFHRGQNRDWPRLWESAPSLNLAPESP